MVKELELDYKSNEYKYNYNLFNKILVERAVDLIELPETFTDRYNEEVVNKHSELLVASLIASTYTGELFDEADHLTGPDRINKSVEVVEMMQLVNFSKAIIKSFDNYWKDRVAQK